MAPWQRGRDAGVCKKKVAYVAESLHDSGSASRSDAATSRDAKSNRGKITGHWGEAAVGFKWTEADSVDNRLAQMDVGRFYSATIYSPHEATLKGIAVRIGDNSEAAVLFDTELLRVTCGWTGKFLEFNPARYGIIVPPKVGGEVAFHSPRMPGWASGGSFNDPRSKPFGPLPREWAKYLGLHLNGNRVVFEYSVGPDEITVLESPWLETADGKSWITREVEIAPAKNALELLVAAAGTKVELVGDAKIVRLNLGDGKSPVTATIAARESPVSFKLRFPIGTDDQRRGAASTLPRDVGSKLRAMTQPGPPRWTAEITTRGVVSPNNAGLVVDTLTLPFENPYRALMFVSGHDFPTSLTRSVSEGGRSRTRANPGLKTDPSLVERSPSLTLRVSDADSRSESAKYDAAICTLHGDVWLVSGIDGTLEKLTWKRFATGLFQPLGLKIVNGVIHVVGRDQITRLHDHNSDGEADFYENFNNDAHVTTNGHEYVTCLETDKDGWFYFVKGNADGKTDHDGCLLRVSPDGRQLEVVATGLRNANGIGIGRPAGGEEDVITVAPQEGEWTPGSGIFEVKPGGFYGYTPSAHRVETPKEFTAPICWIPRLQDNSSGGQVWLPRGLWGKNVPQSLHLSYGQSNLSLLLIERIGAELLGMRRSSSIGTPPTWHPNRQGVTQGGTVPLPLKFESGVMRGRVNPHDGLLYVSGLRGWVSNAVKDGCFQRVRFTNQPLHVPVAVEARSNGVMIAFSDRMPADVLSDPDNFRVQRWNYRWSAAYGSPELRPSAPNQEGREEVEVLSATPVSMFGHGDAVFLELKEFRPVDQLSIEMNLTSFQGERFDRRIDYTVHATRFQPIVVAPSKRPVWPGQLTEAERAKLQPGLKLSIRTTGTPPEGRTTNIVRMAAWHFEPHELRGLIDKQVGNDGAIELVAEGAIEIPQRGSYDFLAEATGTVEVAVGDQAKLIARDMVRGLYRLRIVQRITAAEFDKPVSLRLLWGSKLFETEPLPSTSLFSEPIAESFETAQRGRELFAQHLCARCHRLPDEVVAARTAMPELKAEGPNLAGVGSRLNGDWMFHWMLNPRAMRPSARMPRLFANSDDGRQQASDVAAYLMGRRTGGVSPLVEGSLDEFRSTGGTRGLTPPVRQEIPVNGSRLFESLGCVGCHRLTAAADDTAIASAERMPLRHVGNKFLAGELQNYLLRPRQHFEWSRMPDFSLSQDEAASLTLALTSDTNKPVAAEYPGRPIGDAERGRVLFEKLGCRQCHRVSDDTPLPAAHLPSAFGKPKDRGCLLTRSVSEGERSSKRPIPSLGERSPSLTLRVSAPDFGLDMDSRSELQTFLGRGDERQLANESSAALSRRWVRELQCQACHARDGKSALLPEILSEESDSGLIPENVPSLSWIGDKLHSPWTAAFLKGHVAERPRPWLKLRMPSFSALRADRLAWGFAAEHGLSGESISHRSARDRPLPDGRGTESDATSVSELPLIGEALATRPGLLDCRQCHAIGDLPPTGDKQTLLAPGINFAMTRERLRFDFYRRFTLDPPRYDVTTRMPKLAVDGRTTKVTDIFDGDARQQFEAVWQFLQTVPSATNDP